MQRARNKLTGRIPIWLLLLIALACGLSNCCRSKETWIPEQLPEHPVIQPAQAPVSVAVKLNRLIYEHGDAIEVELRDPMGVTGLSDVWISIVAPKSEDVEVVSLDRGQDGILSGMNSLTLSTSGQMESQDGFLRAEPGEIIYALWFADNSEAAQAALGATIVADFAMVADAGPSVQDSVASDLALSDDEASTTRPVGTLLAKGSLPVQVATQELIVYTTGEAELQNFLDETNSDHIASTPTGDSEYTAHLVRVDTESARPENLAQLLALFGDDEQMVASNAAALEILSLALAYRLEGYLVAVNPRLQPMGAPTIKDPIERDYSMKMSPSDCVPGDPSHPCVRNVPALWTFMSLWDLDQSQVNVAVLDMGFAPNDDFRQREKGGFTECDMTGNKNRCGNGLARGIPTVGSSFVGAKTWHGTGVVSTIGGIVNNGFGAAGVAGQVAVPMMYKYDTLAYAFDLGLGIKMAVDKGASCINISAGYPCNVVTGGPDFNVCSTGGRAALCAILTAGVATAAQITCLASAWIPFIGPGICAVAIGGAVAATTTCLASLPISILSGPIETAVQYATAHGVPVVASAGNVIRPSSVPDPLRDIIDLSEQRTEVWGIVPAVIPSVIAVAATDGNLDNTDFYGDRVDVWAPTPISYVAPTNTNDPSSVEEYTSISATSGAAAFVTGVIANMMAANARLNPQNPALTDSERGSIVASIREILTSDEATLSNIELVSLGYSDQPIRRRKLIDPLAAVQRAARGLVPDLEALGYDTSLGFSERANPDDTPTTATAIAFGTTMSGSIVALPGAVLSSTVADVDHYSFAAPATRPHQADVILDYPTGFGHLIVSGARVVGRVSDQTAQESRETYTVLANPGERVVFSVESNSVTSQSDNVYRIEVSSPQPSAPRLKIAEPQDGTTVCAGQPFFVRANAWYPFDDVTVPPEAVTWTSNGVDLVGSGKTKSITVSAGTHVVSATAWNETEATDAISIIATTCSDTIPVAEILSPEVDMKIEVSEYVDILLQGTATDAEDGVIPGHRLFWRTDQAAVQDPILGTGNSLTVRLYPSQEVCEGETIHTISLQATDSQGNPSIIRTRTIKLHTSC